MKLKNFYKIINELIDDFDELDDVQIICDYEIMKIIKQECMEEENIVYSEIDREVDEYIVSKIKTKDKDEYFIETFKNEGKVKETECNDIIVQEYILDNNEGLLNYLKPFDKTKTFNLKIF